MTRCAPIISRMRDGGWQAWCKPHGWEAPVRATLHRAELDRDDHKGVPRPDHPEWERGPG